MEVKGKLIKKLNVESGTSKAGKEWEKQTCLVETKDEFNNLVAISAFGKDKIKQLNKLEVGMHVTVSCNVYSREYNGKYYHNIDGYWFSNQSNNPDINDGIDESDVPF
tara:strand:+ start:434 stop:757 length:324 start_codon:yes stop_codon:yes gene_type:complete